MFVELQKWFRVRRRYVAYFSILLVLYFEMISRFGIPIAMLKGLVKKNCDDENDKGTYCWSDSTQAFVIGAYFYGYTAQSITAFIARRFTGFFTTYRFWLIAAAVIEMCFPAIATFSVELLIISQTLRGCLAGIMIAFNFNYLAKFSVGEESKGVITACGVVTMIGSGTGGLMAALIIESFTWRHYFYFVGFFLLLGLASHLLFVQESPRNSWYLTAEEKEIIMQSAATKEGRNASNNGSNVMKDHKSLLKRVLCRVYLPAFCVYQFGHGFILYNIVNVIPFYLNDVLRAEPLLIAYLNASLFVLISLSTLIFSAMYQNLDKVLTWLECRMIFTVLQMICQIIFAIGISYCESITGCIIVLAFCAIGSSTLFTGGLVTINYELDPPNSALTLSIWNSFGQMAGFVGPILKTAITDIPPETPEYAAVYKQRWSMFFYVVAGVAVLSSLAVLFAYVLKRDEWIPFKDRIETRK